MSDSLNYLRDKLSGTPTPVQEENSTPDPVVENATEQEQTPVSEVQEPQIEIEQPEPQGVINTESEVKQEQTPKKQYANEQVAELNNFLERNPDKTLEDYQKLKRPAESVEENELIKQYLSEKEGMTASEIALEMKRLEVNDDLDDDFGDDDASLEAKAKRERALLDARKWYTENQKNLFSTEQPSEIPNEAGKQVSYETVYQQLVDEGAKLKEAAKEDYYAKTYKALTEISDITVDVMGEEVKLTLDDNMKRVIREGLDVDKSLSKFYSADGKLTDAKGYIQNLTWWNEDSRAILLAERDKQIEARVRAEVAKTRRNVTLDSTVPTPVTETSNGTKEKVDSWITDRYKKKF